MPGCLRVGGWTPGPALRRFTRASPGACWIGAPNIEEWFSSKEFGRVLTCEVFGSNMVQQSFPDVPEQGLKVCFWEVETWEGGSLYPVKLHLRRRSLQNIAP